MGDRVGDGTGVRVGAGVGVGVGAGVVVTTGVGLGDADRRARSVAPGVRSAADPSAARTGVAVVAGAAGDRSVDAGFEVPSAPIEGAQAPTIEVTNQRVTTVSAALRRFDPIPCIDDIVGRIAFAGRRDDPRPATARRRGRSTTERVSGSSSGSAGR